VRIFHSFIRIFAVSIAPREMSPKEFSRRVDSRERQCNIVVYIKGGGKTQCGNVNWRERADVISEYMRQQEEWNVQNLKRLIGHNRLIGLAHSVKAGYHLT